MTTFHVERLGVAVERNRQALGIAAAARAADILTRGLASQDRMRVIFAAAPSQNEMLAVLTRTPQIDWSRIEAFHMDEYLGLPAGAPQLFSSYLQEHLFSRVRMRSVHLLNAQAADPEAECARYAALLAEKPIDLVCMGIGENGHIAFNDPPVADFDDPLRVKVVRLDDACRRQQVNDGCFPSLETVPRTALTLTVPALMSATVLNAAVPGPAKAEAVRRTLEEPVATSCPASILRTHPSALLFLDLESASRLAGFSNPGKGNIR
jgi:glucosamine-6-phosphate deaminase